MPDKRRLRNRIFFKGLIIFEGEIFTKSGVFKDLKVALILSVLYFCFHVSSFAADITLKWAPNTETDLAGYKIYYKSGLSGGLYEGPDIDQGFSPISIKINDPSDQNYVNPDDPEFLLTGLDDNEDYFFVVTAYDDEEPCNESGFSNEVSTLDGSNADRGSSDSGVDVEGACFIATVGESM